MFIFGIILIALLLIACGVNITSDKKPSERLLSVISNIAFLTYIALTLFNK